ncbi:hypothetical protein GCM10014715_83830 [Streptomyces spiralis]|uniref:Uncharacterized protein n=1 Tax=Streptomyces spiralis TaxID=66376 RepID=A0A919AMC4_9ACTN|nr:hypothetical protein GCM10014715_83830 [Streptomyces spiralis]
MRSAVGRPLSLERSCDSHTGFGRTPRVPLRAHKQQKPRPRPAGPWLLERYGSPAALRKAGRRKLAAREPVPSPTCGGILRKADETNLPQ